MITSLEQGAEYILDTIREAEKESVEDLDKDMIMSVLEDAVITKLEDQLTVEMIDELELHEEEVWFLESYLGHKIKNYYTILNDTITEILTEYLSPDEEDDE